MDLSIIVVNWNSVAYVRKCLGAIAHNSGGLDIEVIVVDNASFDGCHEVVSREFPEAVFIQNKDNLGFGVTNNLAAARAKGSRLLFLNPDTEVLGDALAQMASIFERRPEAGAVGCALRNTDGTIQTSCIQPFPTILNQALDSEIILHMASKFGFWGVGPLLSSAKGLYKVDVISGACLMVRKAAFQAIGGFSPDYFMYTEDIDLCYRMRLAGFVNYYICSAAVVHHGGGSSSNRKERSFANVQMRESVYKYFRKTRGRLYASCYRSTMLTVALARLGLLAALSVPFAFVGRFPSIRSSLIKWLSILRWSLALEKWAR
ncbi:MAG: glycosyltransferase family 2 protein [Nitrospirota bacterium]